MSLYVQTASGIHVPGVRVRCRIPTGKNELGEWVFCGHPTFERDHLRADERHQAECAKANHEHIVAWMRQRHPDALKPWDPELSKWVADNREPLIEGRKKLGGGVT